MKILAALLAPVVVLGALAFTGPLRDVRAIGHSAGAVARLGTTDWSRHADPPASALDQFAPAPSPLRQQRTLPPPPGAVPCPFASPDACRTMRRALARGDLNVCVKHRWRRLFDFPSLATCEEFVRENAG